MLCHHRRRGNHRLLAGGSPAGRGVNVAILDLNAAGRNSPRATTAVEMVEGRNFDHLAGTFFGLEMEAFRKVFDLDFIGTLLPSMIFTRDIIECKRGVVVNISSMDSLRPLTRIPAYSAANASVNNFTVWLAVHLAPQGIRVNAIAPGFSCTDQNRFLLFERKNGALSARGEKTISGTPMRRFGTANESQGALLFLISDMSKFVTGIMIPVDGGFSAYSGVLSSVLRLRVYAGTWREKTRGGPLK